MKRLFLALVIMMMSAVIELKSASAESVRPLVNLRYGFGGDTVTTVENVGTYINNELQFTNDIDVKAGQGLDIGGGVLVDLDPTPVELEFTISYFFNSDSISNYDYTFSRIPLNALAFYKIGEHRIGGGLTYHMNTQLESDVEDREFDNALGFCAEYVFQIEKWRIFGRYTAIEYDYDPIVYYGYQIAKGGSIDGNSFQIGGAYVFG